MSFLAISWAWDQQVGRSSAKLLLLAMADCVSETADLNNLVCYPSNAFLAHRTGLDRKSVQANLQWLFAEGFIVKTGETRGRTKQVTEYRLKEPKSGHLSSVEDAPKGAQISAESSPNLDTFAPDERCPNFPAKVPKFPAKGAQISAERCPNLGHGTSNEPVKEPVKEPKKTRAKSTDVPDGFAEFWHEYPKKDGRAKAMESWKKRGLDSDSALREVVMAALARHRTFRQWTKDDGQFIPHASTWLNQERYLDDVSPGTPAGHVPHHASGNWWTAAGFQNHWEAQNHRCYEHNAHTFRDGKKLASPAEEHA